MPADVAVYPIIPGWNASSDRRRRRRTKRDLRWDADEAAIDARLAAIADADAISHGPARKSPHSLELTPCATSMRATNELGHDDRLRGRDRRREQNFGRARSWPMDAVGFLQPVERRDAAAHSASWWPTNAPQNAATDCWPMDGDTRHATATVANDARPVRARIPSSTVCRATWPTTRSATLAGIDGRGGTAIAAAVVRRGDGDRTGGGVRHGRGRGRGELSRDCWAVVSFL